MDIDLNEEFVGDILVADVVAVGEVVENRSMHEWDFNMDVDGEIELGEIELGVEREEEHFICFLNVVDCCWQIV